MRRAFRSALERASAWQIAAVAVPPLGLGRRKPGHRRERDVDGRTSSRVIQHRATYPQRITLVAETADEAHALERRSGAEHGVTQKPTSRRGWLIALGVLALWLGGLALLTRRELFRPPMEKLAEAGLRVSPGRDALRRAPAGAADRLRVVHVDTTDGGITVNDYLVADLPIAGELHRALGTVGSRAHARAAREHRSRSRWTPASPRSTRRAR